MERIPQPIMDKRGEPHMRRFQEQRWVLDNLVRANGIDWDQPRSLYISGPCGPEGGADIAGVRERVKKMADIAPAFEAVARRRQQRAIHAGLEARGEPLVAGPLPVGLPIINGNFVLIDGDKIVFCQQTKLSQRRRERGFCIQT